jgi:hypothetical protein
VAQSGRVPSELTRRTLLAVSGLALSVGTTPAVERVRAGRRGGIRDPPPFRWAETYDVNRADEGTDVTANGNGTYTVAGATSTGTDTDATNPWLFTVDGRGDGVWQRSYEFDTPAAASSLASVADGGYVLCGGVADVEAETNEALLIRTDEEGASLWRRTYEPPGDTVQPVSVVPAPDGGHAVAGFEAGVQTVTGWSFAVDPEGERRWDRELDEYQYTVPLGLANTDEGYLVFGAARDGTVDTDKPVEAWIAEFDAAGETQWTNRYTHADDETTNASNALVDVARTDDGYVLVGSTAGELTSTDRRGLVVSVEADGTERGTRQVDPPDDWTGAFHSVVPRGDGYVCVGQATPDPTGTGPSTWLVGLGPELAQTWETTQSFEDPSPTSDAVPTADGGLLTVGSAAVDTSEGATDAFAAKFGGEPVETATATPTVTATPTPTETPRPTLVSTETPTLVPTETPTLVPTETPTLVPTETPTRTDPETTSEDGPGFGAADVLTAVGAGVALARLVDRPDDGE